MQKWAICPGKENYSFVFDEKEATVNITRGILHLSGHLELTKVLDDTYDLFVTTESCKENGRNCRKLPKLRRTKICSQLILKVAKDIITEPKFDQKCPIQLVIFDYYLFIFIVQNNHYNLLHFS